MTASKTTNKTTKTVAKKPAPKKVAVKKPTSKNVTPQQAVKTVWYMTPRFARIYALVSVVVLMLTTALWATLGAKVQQSNADQLVNARLFENSHTFREALLPGQHTFLLKWPFFWLIHLLGTSGPAVIGVTIAVTFATVAALAFLLYRIERRPVVIGTIFLALASVLLLIPAQPYAGALLPVNMAMLATRNLEYVVYISALVCLVRWHEVRSWGFWLAVSLLALVMVSDQLFVTLSLGGSLIALAAYVFMRRWKLAQLSVKWLLAGLFAVGVGSLITWAVTGLALTHISSQSTALYGFVHGVHGLLLASAYAAMGLVTNFGANPAYDATILRQAPHLATGRLLGVGGPALIINLVVMLFAGWTALKLVVASLLRGAKHPFHEDKASSVSLMLIWTTLAAIGAFVVTTHYYVVDARYLTISLFALFIALATYSRQKNWPTARLLIIGVVLVSGIVSGSIFSVQIYHGQKAALLEMDNRDSLIAQALSHHPTTLVGDYWRVIPARQAAKTNFGLVPLINCFQPREVLSSRAWQPDLSKVGFAYLLSFDKSATDYPGCSLEQVVSAYGRPNASAVIAGSLEEPKETLLFYDKGAHKSSPSINAASKPPATVVPIALNELPNTSCTNLTIMNIVAHEDDDLLFMNPDVQKDIKAGHCVRTVYVTAGDAGGDEFYWLSREQGSEAAYSQMIGNPNVLWVQRVVKVADGSFLTIANPKDNPRISLIFMRLPDGNLKGQGFRHSHNESLDQLSNGGLGQVQSVTKQSHYTAAQLTSTLSDLMNLYQPGEVHTQSNVAGGKFTDHSDHRAVGRFAERAYQQYEQNHFEGRVKIPFVYYLGYPIHERPQNVFGSELEEKEAAFLAYAAFDAGVCQNTSQCSRNAAYDAYLKRQYTSPN